MFELIDTGGHLMWLLLGCSVLSFFILFDRLLYCHRASVNLAQLLEGVSNLVRRKNFAEAIQNCAVTPGPVARVLHAALIRHDAPRSQLREIVQESGQLEVPKLERSLNTLLTIAYVAPLIGLLGTLLGLIDTFDQVQGNSGFSTTAALSKGIYKSLVTSATGLAVAVPAYLMFAFLVSRVKTIMHDMERAGIEIVNLITDSRVDTEIIGIRDSVAHSGMRPGKTDTQGKV